MVSLSDLLGNGYFPRELPDTFTTSSFSSAVIPIANSFFESIKRDKVIALTSPHNIARVGTLRRKLGIPNPITHFMLCYEIAQNWSDINYHIQRSPISASTPIIGVKRSLIPRYKQKHRSRLRVFCRKGERYLLKTDVSKCYPSIYTHSIPWALHGKPVAKAQRRNFNLLGNKLDNYLRNGQDGQTIGIPIGPDTSLLIAEIILTATDDLVIPNLHKICGFRYVDDYELCFSNLKDAEIAMNVIESALSEYELSLNPRKTDILCLPVPLENNWAIELKKFTIRKTKNGQASDMISYFSQAFKFAKENPEDSVLKYAIASFGRSVPVYQDNWPLFQDLMLQCVTSEPGTIPYVLEQYVRFYHKGFAIMEESLEHILNLQIQHHAPLGHGSEVGWCLWGAIAFNIALDDKTASKVVKMDDSVVALLSLDAKQQGLFNPGLNTSNWEQYMTREGLYEEHWLLSYEANVKGWLPSLTGKDYVSEDKFFGVLKKNDVEFYDPTKAAKIMPTATEPLPGGY